jgi:hypothetical protein
MMTLLNLPFLQGLLPVAVALWLWRRSTMKRLDQICRLLDRIEGHVDAIDGSITRLEGHMDGMDGTLTRLKEGRPPLLRWTKN